MENVTNESHENLNARLIKQGEKILILNIFCMLLTFISVIIFVPLGIVVLAGSGSYFFIILLGIILLFNLITGVKGVLTFTHLFKLSIQKKMLMYSILIFSIFNIILSIFPLQDTIHLLKL